MSIKPVYSNKYHIDYTDVDFLNQLKLSALFSFFQDIATIHAGNLGMDINTLIENYGVTWILMRIRVDIIKNPKLNQDIIIETWPQVPGKLEFERDFIVRDIAGNEIIKAVSTWVIADVKTRQLKRSSLVVDGKYPLVKRSRAIDQKPEKLKISEDLEIAYKKVIGYSDIDINGHLNNSKYIDYIMDCFNIEEHKQFNVRSIEVNYVNEALPGDVVVLYKGISLTNPDTIYVMGMKNENTVVFRARLKVAPK
jgi:medium-chain acyl-[acyl-carrier-protein] hydrolase